jgi:hypothetical protein
VRKLEYDADEQTANERDDGKSNEGLQPPDHDDGQYNIKSYIQYLRDPKNEVFLQLQAPRLRVEGDLSADVFCEIVVKDPRDVGNTVEKHPIHMLKPVKPIPGLTLVETHKGFHIDIRIHPFDIGKGMVIDIVLDLPEVGISTQYIKGIGRDLI